jgi:hypothetical protein
MSNEKVLPAGKFSLRLGCFKFFGDPDLYHGLPRNAEVFCFPVEFFSFYSVFYFPDNDVPRFIEIDMFVLINCKYQLSGE